jgi:peroxiredoxin
VLLACAQPPPKSQPTALLGQRMPPFETETLSGKRLLSESFAGHPVVLSFVKTDCPECERSLQAVSGVFSDNERTVAWAVFEPGNARTINNTAAKLGLEYPVVVDEGDRLKKLFLINTRPTTVVLNQLGYVHWQGGAEMTESELSKVVGEAD